MMESIIYIEPSEGKIDPNVKKIATRLRKIPAEFRGPIKGVTIGSHSEGNEKELKGLLDELIVAEAPQGSEYNTEIFSNILTDLLKANGPSLAFLVFSHQGMELAPAVGMRLGIPTITGCIDFDLAENSANVQRLIYGSKLTLSLSVDVSKGAIFSIQRGSLKGKEQEEIAGSSAPLVVTKLPWRENWKASKSKILGIVEEEGGVSEKEDITKANLLVSVGRGIGGPDNIPLIRKLADRLGGTISCSRPVVDNNWLPHHCQVGTSGKTVSPVVYLALGISGQGNHVAGMDTSRIIIAVNKDPRAPIFKVAHYGIIDDLLQFISELIKQTEVEN
jgi:electron transfer flavoprotein alpha subunit